MCVRDEATLLEANLRYHHARGVDRVYLYLDRCADGSAEIGRRLPFVEPIVRDRRADQTHMSAYQCHVLNDALPRAAANGFGWLLHLDADEFARGDPDAEDGGRDLTRLLRQVDDDVEQIRLPPWDALPLRRDAGRPLHAVDHWHRRGPLRRRLLDPTTNRRRRLSGRLGHDKGKVIARTDRGLLAGSAHTFVRPGGGAPPTRTAGRLYHHVVTDADAWWRKHRKFAEYPATWARGTPVRFPKQAWKEACVTMTRDAARTYFDREVRSRPSALWWARLTGRVTRDAWLGARLRELEPDGPVTAPAPSPTPA